MFLKAQVSRAGGLSRRLRAPLLLLLCGTFAGHVLRAEAPPKPALRLPLKDLGFPGYSLSLLHAGASMASVHALDSTHVLFTYSLRSLVPRVPGDDANDTDRQVAAALVDTSTGKVLSRAVWHLHDHGRYLWSVGAGVFVVRTGQDLSVIAPMQALAHGQEPFLRHSLPHRPGLPTLVAGSPDGRLVTVEMENDLPPAMGDEQPEGQRRKHYTLEFYRLAVEDGGEGFVHLSGAGAIGSPLLLRLAMDGDGYLWAEDGERGKWMISFNEFGGKQEKLAPVLSSCHPRLNLLSRSQFLVETCRGTDQSPMLAAYGFDGHENWQEQFGEALQPPTLAVAPTSGRFAMSRLVASSDGAPVTTLAHDEPLSQEIRVYQTESGDMLLRVACAPVMRSAENFDLAPDGSALFVLGPETLDVYRLPGLTDRDRKDLAEVQAMTPPIGSGPVALGRITRPIAAPDSVAGGEAVHKSDDPPASLGQNTGTQQASLAPAKVPAPAGRTSGTNDGAEPGAVNGDPAAGQPRKAPTLLNPGESAEFKGQPSGPK